MIDTQEVRRGLYSIPYRREVTHEEADLIWTMLERVAPQRHHEIATLKIIGRCGCGMCPTIIFGTSYDQKLPSGILGEIAQYTGFNAQQLEVGIALIVRDDAISELEVWGMEGAVISLPSLRSLIPVVAPIHVVADAV